MKLYLIHADDSSSWAVVDPSEWRHIRLGDFFFGALVAAIVWNVTDHGPLPA